MAAVLRKFMQCRCDGRYSQSNHTLRSNFIDCQTKRERTKNFRIEWERTKALSGTLKPYESNVVSAYMHTLCSHTPVEDLVGGSI